MYNLLISSADICQVLSDVAVVIVGTIYRWENQNDAVTRRFSRARRILSRLRRRLRLWQRVTQRDAIARICGCYEILRYHIPRVCVGSLNRSFVRSFVWQLAFRGAIDTWRVPHSRLTRQR